MQNTAGKGKAVLLGSFLTLSYQRAHEDSAKRLLLSLAQAAGATPEVEVFGPGTQEVEVRRLLDDDLQTVFVFNHSTEPANVTLTLRLPWVPRQAGDLMEDRPVTFQAKDGKILFQKLLEAGEIWVFELKR